MLRFTFSFRSLENGRDNECYNVNAHPRALCAQLTSLFRYRLN